MTDKRKTADLSNAKVGDILVLRCGGKVVITHISKGDDYLVGCGNDYWLYNGFFTACADSPFDCVELIKKPKPKTVKVDFWVNVDDDGSFEAHETKEIADDECHSDRIACINIRRTVTEGEGLE